MKSLLHYISEEKYSIRFGKNNKNSIKSIDILKTANKLIDNGIIKDPEETYFSSITLLANEIRIHVHKDCINLSNMSSMNNRQLTNNECLQEINKLCENHKVTVYIKITDKYTSKVNEICNSINLDYNDNCNYYIEIKSANDLVNLLNKMLHIK